MNDTIGMIVQNTEINDNVFYYDVIMLCFVLKFISVLMH